MGRIILALGLGVGLLSAAGCQGNPAGPVNPRNRTLQEQDFKPPVLHEVLGRKSVAIGTPYHLLIRGDAGTADLKEIVFQVWAAGRGNVETGSFVLPKALRRRASGRIEIDTVASVAFIQSAEFELLPLEVHTWLRDTTGRLSLPRIHRFQFDERAHNAPPFPPPEGRDYSARLGTIVLEIFPLERRNRGFFGIGLRGFQ